MRRNMRRGSGIPSGPLVTNHIRNLDNELEILQRRRELLQHEQQMLSHEGYGRKRQYENNHPSHDYVPFTDYHQADTSTFSHLYDDGSGPSFNCAPQPFKRHTADFSNTWHNDRYGTNQHQHSINQRHGSYMGPGPQCINPPQPLMSLLPRPSIGRRIAGFPSQKPRKTFTPSKVTKPKSKPQTANKASVTPAPMKNTFRSAVDSSFVGQILRADQVPSKQMTGRLELALGSILKEMKQQFCTDEESTQLFNSKHVQRCIKQSIRERLKAVMLNKVVGKFLDIVESYRKTFPKETDKDIMDTAIFSTDTSQYIKVNIFKLMPKKLMEMFEKLQQLYEGADMKVIKIIGSCPRHASIGEVTKEIIEKTKLEKEFYTSLVDSLLEERLPILLPIYIQQIIKILEQDEEFNNAILPKRKLQRLPKNLKESHVTIDIKDNEIDDDVIEVPITETVNADEDVVVLIEDIKNSTPIEASIGETPPMDENNEVVEEKESDIDSVPKTMLKNGVQESNGIVDNADTNKTESELATASPKKPKPVAQQLFVKVLGQPNLPNRDDAFTFLNQFNAVSIKKHKVVQNLLVVGFNNENDFENAIAASGTAVGDSKLIIKANENLPQTPSSKEKETGKDDDKEVLPPDLENQISDLLLSIRKADEQEKEVELKTCMTETISDNLEQPHESENGSNIVEKENASTNELKKENEMVEEGKTVEENVSDETIYSPSNLYDEDSHGMETIKEEVEEKVNTPGIEEDESQSNVDKVTKSNIKDTGRSTPVRSSSRLNNATPSSVRTRRASKLLQNN